MFCREEQFSVEMSAAFSLYFAYPRAVRTWREVVNFAPEVVFGLTAQLLFIA